MKVLVTGGLGYLGSSLIQTLNNNDNVHEIVLYDNLSRGNYNLFFDQKIQHTNKIKFIQGDILDSRKLKSILDSVQVVYHLAAKVLTPFTDKNYHQFEQVNHWGTAELCYAIENSDVEKLIYLSSASVYGNNTKAVTEDDIPTPDTVYGVTKYRGENQLQQISSKIEKVILRCGNVYGFNRSMRFDAVINKFLFKAHMNQKINVHGTGNQLRSFIHLDYITTILNYLLNHTLEKSVYNVIDKNISVMEIIEHIKSIYPNLEMIFINQHIKHRGIEVISNSEINAIYKNQRKTLEEELLAFKSCFTIQ